MATTIERVLAAQVETTPRSARAFRGAPVTFQEVHRVLVRDEPTRGAVLDRFRAAGGDVNRWALADLERMAGALTAAEDAAELDRDCPARRELRARLRALRRRLEDACETRRRAPAHRGAA